MSCFKLTSKGAMFGLDARIALAVLAIISLSVSVISSKKKQENKQNILGYELKIWKNSFLNHWQDLRFKGYYTIPDDTVRSEVTSNSSTVPGFSGYADKRQHFEFESADEGSLTFTSLTDFTYTPTSVVYENSKARPTIKTAGLTGKNLTIFYNYHKSYFDDNTSVTGNYFSSILQDSRYRIATTLNKMMKDYGGGLFTNFTNSDVQSPNFGISEKRDPLGRGLEMYFIVEMNVDRYSPGDYIVHTVFYSRGANNVKDQDPPTNIEELRAFDRIAAKDDLMYVFSTKPIYLKAKAEGLKRLSEIKDKTLQFAEMTYIDRTSLCATESTVSANCDRDSDGDYDNLDKNAIINLNPFFKSSLDTSSADYFNNSVVYDGTDATTSTFILNSLKMPDYYKYDLMGNLLNYHSNMGERTKAPYTMEVWY